MHLHERLEPPSKEGRAAVSDQAEDIRIVQGTAPRPFHERVHPADGEVLA